MKYCIHIFIILLLPSLSFGQYFKAGPIVGLAATQVDGDGYGGFNKAGVSTGIFLQRTSANNQHLSFQFEMQFIQKGARKNAKPDKEEYDAFLLRLNYIELPLFIQYRHKHLAAEIGPYAGMLMYDYMADELGILPRQGVPFKKYDIGGYLGFYYYFNEHFSVNWRSGNSFLPIREIPSIDSHYDIFTRIFNRGWYNIASIISFRYTLYGKTDE